MRITLSASFLLALAGLAQTPAPKSKLPSTVVDWTKLEVRKTAVGERRDYLNQPTETFTNLESHVTTIGPGKEPHPEHQHPDEEIVIIKEGTLEVRFGGKSQQAGPGSLFFFAANDKHGMKNVGTGPASYHVIRIVR